MCGIVGYVGHRSALDVVMGGLRRLEYRGYDSAGVALIDGDHMVAAKKAGKLANLEKAIADTALPTSTTGIGHTRWATHGAPNDRNAHPHNGAQQRVAVVHNGIIENFAVLRAVPHPHIGAFVPVGVVLHARTVDYLGMRAITDIDELRTLVPEVDTELLARYLRSVRAICDGDETAGPVALTHSASAAPQASRIVAGSPGMTSVSDRRLNSILAIVLP